MSSDDAATCDTVCSRISEEIIPILYRVMSSDLVTYRNAHFVPCWERRGCGKTECPAHGNTEIPCWYRTGTFCCQGGEGTVAEKAQWCRECEVFKQCCPTLVEEIGEALNTLLFSLRQEKKNSLLQMARTEYLNKELLSAVENLDNRNREIQELVITDKLTGLYNRNYLMTVLDDEIHRVQRNNELLTTMMIDLDDFKSINDGYGHVCGDRVLSFFGQMLQRTLRKCDRAFRYGGEEFVVVLPGTDFTLAWILAERIRKTYQAEFFQVETKQGVPETISNSVSIGLASYRKGMTAGDLLEQADAAVYQAKSEGKNRISRFGIDGNGWLPAGRMLRQEIGRLRYSRDRGRPCIRNSRSFSPRATRWHWR